MHEKQNEEPYHMQKSSWMQTVSLKVKRYGDTADARNTLQHQHYRVQMLWWTSGQTKTACTANLNFMTLYFLKSLRNEVYLLCLYI